MGCLVCIMAYNSEKRMPTVYVMRRKCFLYSMNTFNALMFNAIIFKRFQTNNEIIK